MADPLVLAALSGFQLRYDAFLIDNREQLLTHPTSLGLGLDLVAVDHTPAIGIGTGAGTLRHRAVRLFLRGFDDLK